MDTSNEAANMARLIGLQRPTGISRASDRLEAEPAERTRSTTPVPMSFSLDVMSNPHRDPLDYPEAPPSIFGRGLSPTRAQNVNYANDLSRGPVADQTGRQLSFAISFPASCTDFLQSNGDGWYTFGCNSISAGNSRMLPGTYWSKSIGSRLPTTTTRKYQYWKKCFVWQCPYQFF